MDKDIAHEVKNSVILFLALINPLFDAADRGDKGGWLHISDPQGNTVIHERIGEIDTAKHDEMYKRFSEEKSERLRVHPEHRTSWQSRSPELDQWGGAFRTDDGWIFSFSGLAELWDEGLVLGVACLHLPLTYQTIASPGVCELVEWVLRLEERRRSALSLLLSQ